MFKSKIFNRMKKDASHEIPKDAQEIERTVEEVYRLAGDFQKGLQQYVLFSKRNKKIPEQQLAIAANESLEKCATTASIFQDALHHVVDVNHSLTELRKTFEAKVEKCVLIPLRHLTEETCTSISKNRAVLNKVSLECSVARDQVTKLSRGPSNMNDTGSGASDARHQQAQILVNEKSKEMETHEVTLLRDLYTFATEEDNYAMLLVEYARLQQDYFEQSLQMLKETVPKMLSNINQIRPKTVFNVHLPKHLAETGRSISYVLEVCITKLDNDETFHGEGLFRKPGSKLKTELLIKALNLMRVDAQLLAACDDMTVASTLKNYLGTLPEPLITYAFAEQWAEATKTPDSDHLGTIKAGVKSMPVEFRRNLAYLCLFLSRLAADSEKNKMTSTNLAIVIAPSLYRLLNSSSNTSVECRTTPDHQVTDIERSLDFLSNSAPAVGLTEMLIDHAEELFAEDIPSLPSPRWDKNRDGTDPHLQRSSEPTLEVNKPVLRRTPDGDTEVPTLSTPPPRPRSAAPPPRPASQMLSPKPLSTKKTAPRPPGPPPPVPALPLNLRKESENSTQPGPTAHSRNNSDVCAASEPTFSATTQQPAPSDEVPPKEQSQRPVHLPNTSEPSSNAIPQQPVPSEGVPLKEPSNKPPRPPNTPGE